MSPTTTITFVLPAVMGGVAFWLLVALGAKMAELASIRREAATARETFEVADRVLKAQGTPPYLRRVILVLLFKLRCDEAAHGFLTPVADDGNESGVSRLLEALVELRQRDPRLGDDAQRAIMGLMVLMGAVYARSAKEAQETRNAAALNSNRLFARFRLPTVAADANYDLPIRAH